MQQFDNADQAIVELQMRVQKLEEAMEHLLTNVDSLESILTDIAHQLLPPEDLKELEEE